jgi:hypothetical protein
LLVAALVLERMRPVTGEAVLEVCYKGLDIPLPPES